MQNSAAPVQAPTGLTAFGVFLCFAASMALLAAFLLAFPGTSLDRLWALNPRAHRQLGSLGPWIAGAFLFLAALLAYTAAHWFRRRVLGWRLAVVIIAAQWFSDAASTLRGDFRSIAGLVIASLLLFFLLSHRVKSAFH